MKKITSFCTRRGFFGGLALGTAALWTRGVFAESLMRTPAQTAGPFYPDKLPLDTDNDLLVINDEITPAVGQITHLSGKILDERGERIKNAVVEIWQVDNNGVYHHSGTANRDKRDTNFQGFGRFTTGSTGEYYFRTIRPVVYPGRQAPHIHFKIKKGGKELLTTQCYVKGHAGNERDGVYKRIGDAKTRASLAVDFAPIEDSRIGELAAQFDIVLGMTPEST
ncbi:MAG: intradiol ring-cleavage dioxygenase [Planctomycetes bacterium]|nr:intradiol ring-cleavage dioxygenase [Planctomycetota bacterium]